jgi:dipeptidyl aminopeptidase/acylaminoacyl peptidase
MADLITKPLLLVHGDADNNPGTHTMQSERMYAALRGLGKTARYVSLPLESHRYRARESLLDALAEIEAWLDRFVGVSGGAPQAAGGSNPR